MNRNDATVVDNLNRATTIGGVARTYDILGNTLTKGSATMQWDALNRMLQYKSDGTMSGGWNYQYRADGMRVKKSNFGYQDSTQWTKYMYDGQMPVEETEYSAGMAGQSTTVRRNALGARGIDRIETVTTQGTSVSYPVYDGHGNMVATLAKQGSGYQIGNRRSFGAWGDVRQGATTGDPKGRYCANLGHVDDDESGLTYMRARYYEASCGRFASEDPAMDGINWYYYCRNNPISFVDQNGRNPALLALNVLLAGIGIAIGYSFAVWLVKMALANDSKMRAEIKEAILDNYERLSGGMLNESLEGLFALGFADMNPTLAGLLDGSLAKSGIAVLRAAGTSFGIGLIVGFLVGMHMAILSFWVASLAFESEGLDNGL